MTGAPVSCPSRWIRLRLILCGLVIVGLFVVVVQRAYRLQVEEGPRLREMAEQQYLKQTDLPPRRGTISDRHGTPLAVSVEVDSIHANPRAIGSRAAEVAQRLAPVLGLEASRLERQLSSRRYFVWLKRRVSRVEAAAVRALKLPGVALTREPRRFYPNRGLGVCTVGFAGLDARGLEGIELRFDSLLRGSPVRLSGLRDALGRPVLAEGSQEIVPAGHDLQLTLDKFIQYETEQALAAAVPTVRPRTGWVSVVVMDPRNGDVLALASAPSFDPNRYEKAPVAARRSRALTDAFEPGSTLKAFTVAAALEAGLVRSDEVIGCERGRWRIGRHVIHDSHPYEKLGLTEVLTRSSNICTAKIGFRLGKRGLYDALRRFGFGERSGADLPGERAGTLRPPRGWSEVGLANIAFGQGMTATVLQLARGYAAIANGGMLLRPRIVESIRDARGALVQHFPPEGKRVLSPDVARRVSNMLAGVTEPGGTGVEAALERYSSAGKTGTAQKVDPVSGTYGKHLWVSSFVGYAPVEKPRLVIAVIVNEPAGEKYYGGEVAGPIFKRIATRALAYLGVRPSRPARGTPAAPAVASGGGPREGYVDEVDLAPPLPVASSGARGELLVPDFTGMSLAEVIAAARRNGLEMELEGSGVAVAQSPGPGPSSRGTVCRVSFRPPG